MLLKLLKRGLHHEEIDWREKIMSEVQAVLTAKPSPPTKGKDVVATPFTAEAIRDSDPQFDLTALEKCRDDQIEDR